MSDFKEWWLTGQPSDFNLIVLNRNHVIKARRISHGPKILVSVPEEDIEIAATFEEFTAWLKGEDQQ